MFDEIHSFLILFFHFAQLWNERVNKFKPKKLQKLFTFDIQLLLRTNEKPR